MLIEFVNRLNSSALDSPQGGRVGGVTGEDQSSGVDIDPIVDGGRVRRNLCWVFEPDSQS